MRRLGEIEAHHADPKRHADEASRRVGVHWCSLYRAINRAGDLVDALPSEMRDMAAAQRRFAQAVDVAGRAPEPVATDGRDTCRRAICKTLGDEATHRCNRYRSNPIGQDQRGVGQR